MIALKDARRMPPGLFKVHFVLKRLLKDSGVGRLSLRALSYHTAMPVGDVVAALDELAAQQIDGEPLLSWQRLPTTPRKTKSQMIDVRLWPNAEKAKAPGMTTRR